MTASTPPNIGSVTRGPSRGKLIVEWQIAADRRSFTRVPEGQPFLHEDAVVKVYMTNLTLRAESPFLDAPIEGTDLAALHAEVQAQVRERLALRTALSWERWLMVEVREVKSSFSNRTSMGTEIGYTPIWYAVGPDGTKYTVHDTNNVVTLLAPELEPGRDEKGQPRSFEDLDGYNFSNDRGICSRTYVPATEKNLAAIHLIQGRLSELALALGDLLRPGESQKVLDSIPETPAGGAPALLGWLPKA